MFDMKKISNKEKELKTIETAAQNFAELFLCVFLEKVENSKEKITNNNKKNNKNDNFRKNNKK